MGLRDKFIEKWLWWWDFFKMCVMYININIYIYEIKIINLDFNIFRYLALIL